MAKPAFNKKEDTFQYQTGLRFKKALIGTTLCMVLEIEHRKVDQK
jgi:hypothetical protein